jgi:hypothetical protein
MHVPADAMVIRGLGALDIMNDSFKRKSGQAGQGRIRVSLLTAVMVLAATAAHAADTLTDDEIARLQFGKALAYAEAIDAYCFPDWHYVTADLAAAAIAELGLQNKPFVELDQTLDVASHLKSDQSACEPAKAFVKRVAATIPKIQPRMDATLAVLKKQEAQREAARTSAARIAQCSDVVARVKEFLAAHWSLANGNYADELPRCIIDLSAMPEAEALLADAKTVLPQMTESIKARSAKDSAVLEPGEVDPKRAIADWCAKQSEKTALCDDAAK